MPKKISKKRLAKIDELADGIVSDMDMEALIDYARGQMIGLLSTLTKKEFDEAWDDYYQVDYVLKEHGLSMDEINKFCGGSK